LFDQTFVNANAQTRRPWTVAISLAFQAVLVAVALIAPLLHIAKLETPPRIPIWVPVQVDLNVKPEIQPRAHAITAARPAFHLSKLFDPAAVPKTVDFAPDAPTISGAATAIGPALPSLGELLPAPAARPQPPQPPVVKPPAPLSAAPVTVGGAVQSARLIFGPKPAYPPLARTTRTQGTVRVQALIGRDGIIRNLQLVSGPPLLVSVAMEAVRQWRYRPTLLNGEPVEVLTEIDVNFTLAQ
jgi:protein TonB